MFLATQQVTTAELPYEEDIYCQYCRNETLFYAVLEYTKTGWFFVLTFVTRERYWLLCNECGNGFRVKKQYLADVVKKSPISFVERYGLFLLLIPILLGYTCLFSWVGFFEKRWR